MRNTSAQPETQIPTPNTHHRNGCCSVRNPCPAHREISLRYRAKPGDRYVFVVEDERIEDLNKLAHERYGDRLPAFAEGERFAFVMAHHIAEPNRIRAYLDRAAPWYDEDGIDELIKGVAKRRHRWTADKLASPKWLNVSYAERQKLGLKTIGAYDMPKKKRTALRRERYLPRRRILDRLRQERQRRKQGKLTRAAWLKANNASREKPWNKAGVSRATWYRQQQRKR